MIEFFTYFILAVLSIVIHEWSHGMVAYLRGDPTAKILGRLSLNPIRHVDPFGTVVLPIALYWIAGLAFGWAKPVPINANYLRSPRLDMILVAFAGPLSNFILGFFGFLCIECIPNLLPFIKESLMFFITFNISIGAFNLIPILPLDGGRVLGELLPRSLAYWWYSLERFGMLIVFTLIVILPQIEKVLNIHIFSLTRFLFASRTIILKIYIYLLGFIR